MRGVQVFLLAELLVVLGATAAHQDSFFTVKQMRARGVQQGIPFIAHGGMWGDLLFVSPLVGWMVQAYVGQWSAAQMVGCAVTAIAATAGMHRMYAKITLPEAHIHDGRATEAAWWHALYMAGALTVLFLYYFCTHGQSALELMLVGSGVTIHMMFGTHVILRALKPTWYPRLPLFTRESVVQLVAIAALISVRSYFLAVS